jgi:hypothetical protein
MAAAPPATQTWPLQHQARGSFKAAQSEAAGGIAFSARER